MQSETQQQQQQQQGQILGIYTIPNTNSMNDSKNGHDNFAHTITDLTETEFHTIPIDKDSELDYNEMTPVPNGLKMGKKTAIGIDVIITWLVAIWLILIEIGLFPQIKRGFYCDDRTIDYKFNGDTVPTSALIYTSFVPLFLIWGTEAIFYKPNSLKTSKLRGTWLKTIRWFREYAIGMVFKLFIVDALKVLVGELRPHFLDTCRPDAALNCTNGEYIIDYVCTNTDDSVYFVRDSSKSFPSGHSSMSFFEAIFMIWYFQYRLPKLRSKFLLPFLQTLCVFWACFCSMSRITDHRHHWWDVLTGASMGILFASLTCAILCRNFKEDYKTTPSTNQNGTADYHTSVRRLLSDTSCKDEVTLNHVADS